MLCNLLVYVVIDYKTNNFLLLFESPAIFHCAAIVDLTDFNKFGYIQE